MQVYKELRIISARPSNSDESTVTHKLYGFISGKNRCSALMWSRRAIIEIKKVLKDGFVPILVGGTGLYIKTLMDGISDVPMTSEESKKKSRKSSTK